LSQETSSHQISSSQEAIGLVEKKTTLDLDGMQSNPETLCQGKNFIKHHLRSLSFHEYTSEIQGARPGGKNLIKHHLFLELRRASPQIS